MLRPRPTEIGLTMSDINKTAERIAARQKANGKARIRQGAERSRDEAMRSLGRVPRLRPPMAAMHFLDVDSIDVGMHQFAKTKLISANRALERSQVSIGCDLDGISSGGELFTTFDFLNPPLGLTLSQSGQEVRARNTSLGQEIYQLHLDGQADYAHTSTSPPHENPPATTMLSGAPQKVRRGRRAELPRSPLYQSQRMSPPLNSSSSQPRRWSVRQQSTLTDGSADHHQTLQVRIETSQSTPNFASRISNRHLPDYPMGEDREDEYPMSRNTPGSAQSTRTSSHSSSASGAVEGDLPSPLEHISQQAANYRSRVASRSVTRARVAEVLERINLLEEHPHPVFAADQTGLARNAPAMSPTSPSFIGSSAERYLLSPQRNISSSGRSASYAAASSAQQMTRGSALSSLELESDDFRQPTNRHRRTFLTRPRVLDVVEPLESSITAIGRIGRQGEREMLFNHREADIVVGSAHIGRRIPPSGQGDARASPAAINGRVPNVSYERNPGATMPTSPSPRQRRNNTSFTHIAGAATGVQNMQTGDPHPDSIVLPRLRATSTAATTTRDPYARNNDFVMRMASTEQLESEIGRHQRPTPPPAVGFGRPGSSRRGNDGGPRNGSRALPRWQRDQENSEEIAMGSLQEDFMAMQVRTDTDHEGGVPLPGVMDNTPPRETRLERYWRD